MAKDAPVGLAQEGQGFLLAPRHLLPRMSPEATLVGEEAMAGPGLGLGALGSCLCLAV